MYFYISPKVRLVLKGNIFIWIFWKIIRPLLNWNSHHYFQNLCIKRFWFLALDVFLKSQKFKTMAGSSIYYRIKDFQNNTYKECSPLANFFKPQILLKSINIQSCWLKNRAHNCNFSDIWLVKPLDLSNIGKTSFKFPGLYNSIEHLTELGLWTWLNAKFTIPISSYQ